MTPHPDAPAVLVRDAPTAMAVLLLAGVRPVLLLSPPAAVEAMGAAWFLAVVAVAAAAVPDAAATAVLDCDTAPGHALAAVRLGARRLVLSRDVPGFAAVAGAAGSVGAVVWPAAPPAFDAGAGLRHPGGQARLLTWLQQWRRDR